MGDSISDQIISGIETDANLYWVSIGKAVPENYNIGIKNGLWAVKDEHVHRIENVKKGDYVLFYGKYSGFALCEILEGHFTDTTPVWPDAVYPNRIRISKPLLTEKTKPKDFHLCFIDREGKPYISANALSMATRGAGGVFRQLKNDEINCIFDKLGWSTSKEEGLRQFIQSVLKGYLQAKSEIFNSTHPMYTLLKEEFPALLKKLTINSDLYKFDGSGQGNWATIPWVAVLNKNITTSVQSGYYPVYLFKEDMSGVYLSLNQGVTNLKTELGTVKAIETLNSNSLKFREKINNYIENPEEYEENISLNHPLYEAGNIYAKYYSVDELPSEEKLESDYNEILELYNQLSFPDPEMGIRNFFKNVLEKYLAAKTNVNLAKKLVKYANGGNFHKYLINIANQISNGNYNTYGSFGASNNLDWLPYVAIYDKNNATRFHIRFAFREDMEGVYLSINQSPWTMENKLKNDGLIVQKFSEEFQKHLKKEASEARNELNSLTTIPNDFTDKIDLGSEKAISAPSIEAGNVYGKYYTLDNLPSEEKLVTDFKELLTIYEKLEVDPSIPESINIKEPLEFIFNKLPLAKKRNEKVKGHEVGKAFSYISKAILDIANSIHPERSYHSVAYYQARGKWYYKPYIYIEDLANKDKYSHWDQHFVGLWFSEDLDGVKFSLAQNGTYSHNFLQDKLGSEYTDEELPKYILNHTTQIKKELNDSVGISDNLLEESSKLSDKNTVYGKYYYRNSLPSNDQIISDLKELLNLYSQLKPDELKDENGSKIIEETNEIKEPPKYDNFFEFLTNKGYLFDPKLVENFLLSFKAKPFIILTGNSGTGKTKIAQLFSEYLAIKNGKCHKIVPVGANWTENRHIVGFYNVITKDYMKSDALELILEASKDENENKPFFLVLDEMNLSHVERYFADFLSAMESNEEISLHKSTDEEKKSIEEKIPQSIEIPKNLFVIGTVNVDETTYMFSPKVLDRANVIEFSTIPVKNYMSNGLKLEDLKGDIDYLEDPLYSHNLDKSLKMSRIDDLKGYLENVETIDGENLWEVLSDELNRFQKILKEANYDFGFRVIDEILRFMYVAWIYEDKPMIWDNWMRYFDAQIKQKMLPKLHGSQRVLENVLKELFKQCLHESIDISPRFVDLDMDVNVKYLSSAMKIQEMDKVLNEQRYVSFIN